MPYKSPVDAVCSRPSARLADGAVKQQGQQFATLAGAGHERAAMVMSAQRVARPAGYDPVDDRTALCLTKPTC